MNTTEHLGLDLPGDSDWADVDVLNQNFEKLDAAAQKTDEELEGKAPASHAVQHAANGSDPITPKGIGAAPTVHTHTKSDISDFPTRLPASDVSAGEKAKAKPTYTEAEVGATPTVHQHTKSDISDFPTKLPASDVYA